MEKDILIIVKNIRILLQEILEIILDKIETAAKKASKLLVA